MQDFSTGEIRELPERFLKGIATLTAGPNPFAGLEERVQAAKDAVQPIRENQGPTFYIGEEIEVKGGRFRVAGITSKRIYLDSLPAER